MNDAPQLRLKREDAARQVHIKVGEVFEIELSQASGTGFRWFLAADGMSSELLDERMIPLGTAPGSPATSTWTFRATMQGNSLIRFLLRRPWEQQPVDQVEFKIAVD